MKFLNFFILTCSIVTHASNPILLFTDQTQCEQVDQEARKLIAKAVRLIKRASDPLLAPALAHSKLTLIPSDIHTLQGSAPKNSPIWDISCSCSAPLIRVLDQGNQEIQLTEAKLQLPTTLDPLNTYDLSTPARRNFDPRTPIGKIVPKLLELLPSIIAYNALFNPLSRILYQVTPTGYNLWRSEQSRTSTHPEFTHPLLKTLNLFCTEQVDFILCCKHDSQSKRTVSFSNLSCTGAPGHFSYSYQTNPDYPAPSCLQLQNIFHALFGRENSEKIMSQLKHISFLPQIEHHAFLDILSGNKVGIFRACFRVPALLPVSVLYEEDLKSLHYNCNHNPVRISQALGSFFNRETP
jgi:hypothetical protein